MLIPIGVVNVSDIPAINAAFFNLIRLACEQYPQMGFDTYHGPIQKGEDNPYSMEYIFDERVKDRTRMDLRIRFGPELIRKHGGPVSLTVDTKITNLGEGKVELGYLCKLSLSGDLVEDQGEMILIGDAIRFVGAVLEVVNHAAKNTFQYGDLT